MAIRRVEGFRDPHSGRGAASGSGARRSLGRAAAAFLLAAALGGCRYPAVTWLQLTSGGATVSTASAVAPIIVLAPGATFTITANVGNSGDQSDVAVGEYSITTTSNQIIRPATPFGTPTTLPPNTLNVVTWTFTDTFAANLAHDAYIVHVCAKGQSPTVFGCLDIQVNLTTDPGVITAETVTFEQMRDCILYNRLGSIESLLQILPAGFRSEYTLMHRTLSRQAATFSEPRVIMTGPTAKLVVAFNGGDPNTPLDRSPNAVPGAAKELEMIQFRDATKTFEFRSIDFSGGARVRIGAADPPLCMQCHGVSLRPNWEPYPYWPGAYGSADDGTLAIAEFLGSPQVAQDTSVYCNDPEVAGLPVCQTIAAKLAAENGGMVAFKSNYTSHPRYAPLVNLLQQYAAGYAGSNNQVLTTRLARLNFQRIAHQVSQSTTPGQDPSTYQYSKYLIALLLSTCLESTAIPKSNYLPPQFMNVVPDSYLLSMLCPLSIPTYQCTYDTFFENLGYTTYDWPMNFYRSDRNLAVPVFSTEPKSALLYWLVAQDPQLAPYFNLSPNCTAPEYNHNVERHRTCTATIKPPGAPACISLATASYVTLQQWPNPPNF